MSRSEIQLGRPVNSSRRRSRQYNDHHSLTRNSLSVSLRSLVSLRTCNPKAIACLTAIPHTVHDLPLLARIEYFLKARFTCSTDQLRVSRVQERLNRQCAEARDPGSEFFDPFLKQRLGHSRPNDRDNRPDNQHWSGGRI